MHDQAIVLNLYRCPLIGDEIDLEARYCIDLFMYKPSPETGFLA